MGFFKADDIVAALILSFMMFRRMETISVRREDNLHVSDADFAAWRTMALAGYNRVALVSFLKVVASVVWFQTFKNTSGVLQVGGLLIFVAWAVISVMSWRTITEAVARRRELAIGHKKD